MTVVAVIVLTIAVLGLLASRKSGRSRSTIRPGRTRELNEISPSEFEQLVAVRLGQIGFTQVRLNGGTGDRGVDIYAVSPYGVPYVVQCKRYRADRSVSASKMRDFIGTVSLHGSSYRGLLVTSGRVTMSNRQYAAQSGRVEVIEFTELYR